MIIEVKCPVEHIRMWKNEKEKFVIAHFYSTGGQEGTWKFINRRTNKSPPEELGLDFPNEVGRPTDEEVLKAIELQDNF